MALSLRDLACKLSHTCSVDLDARTVSQGSFSDIGWQNLLGRKLSVEQTTERLTVTVFLWYHAKTFHSSLNGWVPLGLRLFVSLFHWQQKCQYNGYSDVDSTPFMDSIFAEATFHQVGVASKLCAKSSKARRVAWQLPERKDSLIHHATIFVPTLDEQILGFARSFGCYRWRVRRRPFFRRYQPSHAQYRVPS